MKTSTLFVMGLSLTLTQVQAQVNSPTSANPVTLPASTAYHEVDRGANHKVWQRETYESGPNGQVITRIHKYTELATGMNYQNDQGQWLDSKEIIESYAGGAIARQGQYQVIFANNLNSAGAIDEQTPDGKRLRSNILGLGYYDSATDQSVLIAQVQDSQGELIGDNQVLYPNAFKGVQADVRYTYKKGSFEQDVILRQQPPTPESYGLNPSTTELEVITEFLQPPAATVKARPGLNAVDEDVSWGVMRLGRGKAFDLGDENSLKHIPVRRHYDTVNGRNILLEIVPLPNIQAQLKKLPLQSSIRAKSPFLLAKNQWLPKAPLASTSHQPMKLAAHTPANQGYVLDYIEMNTDTNDYTFQADTTYLISGWINLSGIGTFEGGTVVKYDTGQSSGIQIWGNAVGTGSAYRPAVFTSQNDDTVGEELSVADTPMNYDTALSIDASWSNVTLQNMRFSYCRNALHPTCVDFKLRNTQFINCEDPFYPDAYWEFDGSGQMTCELNNILISDADTAFGGSAYIISATHVTVDGCTELTGTWESPSDNSVALTNSLLVNVADAGPVPLVTDHTAWTTNHVFKVAGGGSHYLADDTYRNQGTTAISSDDLANIASKTTYAPLVYSNVTLSAAMTFSPQAARDTDTPDLGYHYDPLDYCFGGVNVSSNVVFTTGTAVGWFELPGSDGPGYGLGIVRGVNVSFPGTVTQPDVFTRYSTVQEGSTNLWQDKGWLGGIVNVDSYSTNNIPGITASFTQITKLAGDSNHYRDGASGQPVYFQGTDCEFLNGGGGYNIQNAFTNCLIDRGGGGNSTSATYPYEIYVNCTFHGGSLTFGHSEGSAPYWYSCLRNCAFENTTFAIDDPFGANTNYANYDYNSFLPGAAQPPTEGAHTIIVTNGYNWQSSWFGNYYLPSDSPLIDAGNPTADLLGLYHFTTQTNQVKETNSIVDIGYHYVAVDPDTGQPYSTYTNGIPDYIADADGNGMPDWWELEHFGHTDVDPNADPDGDFLSNAQEFHYGTDPNNADTDGDGRTDWQEIVNGTDPLNATSYAAFPIAAFKPLISSPVQPHIEGLQPFLATTTYSGTSVYYVSNGVAGGRYKVLGAPTLFGPWTWAGFAQPVDMNNRTTYYNIIISGMTMYFYMLGDAYGDADGDDLADAMEAGFGGNPQVAEPKWEEDSDGDGLPDLYETMIGFNPNSAEAAPGLPSYSKNPIQ